MSKLSNIPVASAVPINGADTGQASLPQFLNELGARQFLHSKGFPEGLQDSFVDTLVKVPIRFFILDDSGSMSIHDGKRVVVSRGKKTMIQCSRWTELTESLKFHVNFSRQASAPSEFRLLNGAPPIRIGLNDIDEADRLTTLMTILDGSPSGGTPLCRHIREVIDQIRAAEHELRVSGQKACVIIATDGESSDGDVAAAMQPLRALPVWVVVRLCTDEDRIVEYWNNIDSELELDMDVLDDLSGEAEETHKVNPWLTYGEPIQRLREFGIVIKELDLLDERKLSLDEVRRVAKIIYGGRLEDYPHPEADFAAFTHYLDARNADVGDVWDPISKKNKQWINTKKLAAAYGKNGCILA